MFKMVGLLGVIAIVLFSLHVAKGPEVDRQFSVTAEGSVFAVPNVAEIRLGVTTRDVASAEEATKENVEKMNKVIDAIKDEGVEAADIKTTNYNLYPNYNYTRDSGRELTGWNLDQTVTVKIRDLDATGDVLAAATRAGANQAGGVQFTIDDEDQLKADARNEAIQKAQLKAQDIADVSGIDLGDVINVYENEGFYPGPIYARAEGFGASFDEGIPSPDIQPGENEVKVSVTLVYEVE